MIKNWEINGNLNDSEYGIKNYATFEKCVVKIKEMYDDKFGKELLDKICFLVDNAQEASGSGYTPITTPVLNKFCVIKLCIRNDDSEVKICFQFAHELMHLVFFSYYGISKPRAGIAEESICSAASLLAIKMLYPNSLNEYIMYVAGLDNEGYKKGMEVAVECDYDFNNLFNLMKTVY